MSKKFYIAISLLAITAGIGAIFIENMSIEMVTPIVTGILGLIYGVHTKFEFEDVKNDLTLSELMVEDYKGYLQIERRNALIAHNELHLLNVELRNKLEEITSKPGSVVSVELPVQPELLDKPKPKKRNKKTDK